LQHYANSRNIQLPNEALLSYDWPLNKQNLPILAALSAIVTNIELLGHHSIWGGHPFPGLVVQ